MIKSQIIGFSEKNNIFDIGFLQIKRQSFDFKSKYWPFSTVLPIKLYSMCYINRTFILYIAFPSLDVLDFLLMLLLKSITAKVFLISMPSQLHVFNRKINITNIVYLYA